MSQSAKKKTPGQVILGVIEWVVIGLLAVLVLFVLIFASKKPGAESSGSVFGFETRLVLSDSMNADADFYDSKDYKVKSIAAGDCVFIRDCDYGNEQSRDSFYSDLEVGDIVTYYSNRFAVYVTHRITGVTITANDIEYVIQGDNVESSEYGIETVKKSDNVIVGEVIGKSTFVGWFYTSFLSNKVAIVFCVTVPCALGATYEAFKIAGIVKEGKREKAEEAAKAKDDEIERLKAELAQLKGQDKGE